MELTSRPFDPGSDIVGIRDFLSSLAGRIGQDRVLHTGDWLWRLFLREDRTIAAQDDIRIWTVAGDRIAGFCWFTPPGDIDLQVDPAQSPNGEIERSMVDWALTRQEAGSTEESNPLLADAFEHDDRKIRVLASLDFAERTGHVYNLYRQSLTGAETRAAVPTGASIRAVSGTAELADRVAIHREVWHPSRFTENSYRAVRAAPGFLPDLDLVAIAPDGRIASYCICWYDPVNRIGEFEPVGTRSEFRRQGYSRAVIAEGLRRLRSLGATEAIVFADGSEEPSNSLYTVCGFSVLGRDLSFERPANASSSHK